MLQVACGQIGLANFYQRITYDGVGILKAKLTGNALCGLQFKHMKHNKNHDNNPGSELIPVHFEFTHPTAKNVSVAGTFNHWQPEAKTLHASGGGRWIKESALAPGNYEYCFVVDGQWMSDPLAKESVANPFGGKNSVLKVIRS
jgi:1,4-alpha-glucan branching enzyme